MDVDSNMIRQAKSNLKGLENVELVEADFAHVKLPTKLDVIFSNARFIGFMTMHKFSSIFGIC